MLLAFIIIGILLFFISSLFSTMDKFWTAKQLSNDNVAEPLSPLIALSNSLVLTLNNLKEAIKA